MPTEAKREGNARHVAKLDLIKIQPYREEGATIRAAAADAGQSLQAYVLQAVRERMLRESSGISSPTPSGNIQTSHHKSPVQSVFCWDYGLSSSQRDKRLEEDHKRFVELCAIRSERELSEKEYLEFMYLLTIHKEN